LRAAETCEGVGPGNADPDGVGSDSLCLGDWTGMAGAAESALGIRFGRPAGSAGWNLGACPAGVGAAGLLLA